MSKEMLTKLAWDSGLTTLAAVGVNESFYKDVHAQHYDFGRFARKVIRKEWCSLTIVKFLAFGILGEKRKVVNILSTYCPNWRACFWRFVVFHHHILI